MTTASIDSAKIHWQDGNPVSDQFDDMYFNLGSGVEESSHVFINGNNLTKRFAALSHTATFTIAETGFGTGLNFLLACQEWLINAPTGARLHYVSAECFPLSKSDLQKALSNWPQFSSLAAELVDQYPVEVSGFHRLQFSHGRISLTLLYFPADQAYSQLTAHVDAWFLDGFAPSKNPTMWSSALFQQMARLSSPKTSLATFTAAGFVRRGLNEVGFNTQKIPGFGRKREMTVAWFKPDQPIDQEKPYKPWFQQHTLPTPAHRKVLVIGAGLAGASTARALADKGFSVTVFDKSSEVAAGGSGNYQGGLYTKLPVNWTANSQLHVEGMGYTSRVLKTIDAAKRFHDICGLLQLAHSPNEVTRQNKVAESGLWTPQFSQQVSQLKAQTLSNCNIKFGGIHVPSGGWVCPPEFCKSLLEHPNIEVHLNTEVSGLDRSNDQWLATTLSGKSFTFPTVVICTAHDIQHLSQTAYLPVKPIRGQTSVTDAKDLPQTTQLLCGEGYFPPAHKGKVCFGATFNLHDKSTKIRQADNEANIKKVASMLDIDHVQPNDNIIGRVSFRCSTPDYAPIVGPVAEFERFINTYKPLSKDRNWPFDCMPNTNFIGLYVNAGHGSKGLITAPLGGEIIASLISGAPLPVMSDIYHA
ncbi:MAG: bifunctional tRNA (5-methylaminomethyl-2-thiouridine)(34)-methyltransferase MnmD/FAD-dependent 5-carboxymethylaminomethyl-2-thiouridine(34) oxidoreductase MnmC, partial [Pontibacterium sp.]